MLPKPSGVGKSGKPGPSESPCWNSGELSSPGARSRGWRSRSPCGRGSVPARRSWWPIRRSPRDRAAIRGPPPSSRPAVVLFDVIGVWEEIAATAQPILDMAVTDSALEDATRPVFLTFGGDVEPGEPFAHMVENRLLIDALVRRAEASDITLRVGAVTSLRGAARCHRRDAGRRRRRSKPISLSPPTARARAARRAGIAGLWLGLRPIRDRRHHRARARSQRPRRGAFPARPVRSRSCR